jgi:hypothetical protein
VEGTRHSAISADGVRTGLLTARSGPALLLVHGGMGTISNWQRVWAPLTAHRRVTAMDRHGRGSSGRSRGPVPQDEPVLRRYLLAGLLACGLCGRRMESAWSNGKAAYRCRHGRTSAMAPDPSRPKNTYIREDKLLPHLPALHLFLTTPATRARRRTRAGADVTGTVSPGEVIGYLREHEITLTWNPAADALQARVPETAKTVTVKAS